MKHRLWNEFRAFIGGYFWLPCPICGEYFGGHEKSGLLMIDWSRGRGVCSDCIKEADRRNKVWIKNNPSPFEIQRDKFKGTILLASNKPDKHGCLITEEILQSPEFVESTKKLLGTPVTIDYDQSKIVGEVVSVTIEETRVVAVIEFSDQETADKLSAFDFYCGPTIITEDDGKTGSCLRSESGIAAFYQHVDPDIKPFKKVN